VLIPDPSALDAVQDAKLGAGLTLSSLCAAGANTSAEVGCTASPEHMGSGMAEKSLDNTGDEAGPDESPADYGLQIPANEPRVSGTIAGAATEAQDASPSAPDEHQRQDGDDLFLDIADFERGCEESASGQVR